MQLRQLSARGDGELVRTAGRIAALAEPEQASGLPGDVVWWRRVSGMVERPRFMARPVRDVPTSVAERAVDFLVADETGQLTRVDVSDARLLSLDAHEHPLGDHVLRVGDTVEVIDRKDRRVDPRANPALRSAPEMSVLRASATRPLLVLVSTPEPKTLAELATIRQLATAATS